MAAFTAKNHNLQEYTYFWHRLPLFFGGGKGYVGWVMSKLKTKFLRAPFVPSFRWGLLLLLSAAALGSAAADNPEGAKNKTGPVYISDWTRDRLSATQGWGGLGVDTAVKPPGNATPVKLSIGGNEYARGLGAHANGTITLQLDGKYETLEAEIGVQTQLNHIGSVVFCVLGDGEELFRSDVMKGGQQARKIRVSVKGFRNLVLALEDAGDGIEGDAGNWAEARLIPAATPWLRPLTPPSHNLASTALAFVSDPDLDHGEPLQMEADGSYRLDPGPDGKARIGLQWEEGLCPGHLVDSE